MDKTKLPVLYNLPQYTCLPSLLCILQTSIQGRSGFLQFDSSGKRQNFSIILTELSGYHAYQVRSRTLIHILSSHMEKSLTKLQMGLETVQIEWSSMIEITSRFLMIFVRARNWSELLVQGWSMILRFSKSQYPSLWTKNSWKGWHARVVNLNCIYFLNF